VGDDHEEVALPPLGLGEFLRHLAEAVGQVADLVSGSRLRELGVVVARRNLIGGARESQHRLRQPPRQVPDEAGCDAEPREESQPHPPGQREPARAELGPRLGHDESAEGVAA
jgi:hypothetical protein